MQNQLLGPDERTLSTNDAIIGGAVGLAFGVLLDYLVLFCTRFLGLPWSGPDLNQVPAALWFVPVLMISTALGVYYYSSER